MSMPALDIPLGQDMLVLHSQFGGAASLTGAAAAAAAGGRLQQQQSTLQQIMRGRQGASFSAVGQYGAGKQAAAACSLLS